ncbi:MAG: hypothetical protein D6702_05370 [Planctomycetota bacterium]|nr:MAG: hypothetical protein D6702_05370 [Planctomycetota bacterium]
MRPATALLLGILAWAGLAAPARTQDLDRLHFSGDFRLRAESSHGLKTSPQHDRYRGRLRLRLAADYQATAGTSIGFRVRTGNSDDPNNPHQDLGGTGGSNFDSFALSLDRAFLKYVPDWAEGWWLVGGKFGRPGYWNPVYGELVWDRDVQPEGLAVGAGGDGGGAVQAWDVFLADYILTEQAGGEEATMLNAGAHAAFADGFDAALNYYFYGDVTPDGNRGILADNAGNATNRAGNQFRSEFGVLNPILAWRSRDPELPLTISGEYVLNLRAAAGVGDRGWALGAAWGGDARIYYQYQSIEQDAIFSAFAQDDFLLTTNHDSHVLGWIVPLAEDVSLHLWGMVSAPHRSGAGLPPGDRYRFRLDLNLCF